MNCGCGCSNDPPRWLTNSLLAVIGLCGVPILILMGFAWFQDPENFGTNMVRAAGYYTGHVR